MISTRASLRLEPTDQIRAAWAAGNQIAALRIAARFFDRSMDTKAFKRGMDAYTNPRFYQQLGKDPEQLTAVALELLAKKFSLYLNCGSDGVQLAHPLAPVALVVTCPAFFVSTRHRAPTNG